MRELWLMIRHPFMVRRWLKLEIMLEQNVRLSWAAKYDLDRIRRTLAGTASQRSEAENG